MRFGLYLHIPYCLAKCRYCDFYSAGASRAVPDEYVDALIARMAAMCPGRPETVYFGGGTPSLLSPAQAARLVNAADPLPGAEITLEANPETVDEAKLAGFRAAGVNRLSLGVQTANDESLARLGRPHTAAQSRAALAAARKAGFENITGDIMLALPQYTREEFDRTLALLAEGGAAHISAYLLKIEPGTVFGKNPPPGLPNEDEAADFYLYAVERLAKAGYAQYEISNFARPGFEGKHNLIYWDCRDYLGLGPAAASCMEGRRFSFGRSTREFLAGAAPAEEGECTGADYIMLRLRLADGLRLSLLRERYGLAFDEGRLAFIRRCVAAGYALFDGDRLALTPKGMLVQNSILTELLP
ncbi:MAG TPA: radical SAM family heme chaperone HemW [Candidatus Fournierella merdavium]|nr:radical SAM family heme chaperone HemW [Candidatus Fournierella merdavium]